MPKPRERETRKCRAAWAALAAATIGLGLLGPAGRAGADQVLLDIATAAPGSIAPKEMIGTWLTIASMDGRPQPVRLEIHTVEPGRTAGKLSYSSPKRCFVDLEYGGPDNDRHIFYIVPFTNCFRYRKSDYIAVTGTEPVAPVLSDLSAQAPGYRYLPREQRAGKDTPASDADPANPSAKAGEAPAEQVEYTITLGDQAFEFGVLTRQ